MKILSLTIQGFRSFTSQQEVDFSKLRPGLYHLSGKNEVEPSISPNGAGKSSLLEAVCWVAYGTTSRKLKAGAVGNWEREEQCGGILEVRTAQHELGIFRVWSPKGNTLEVSIDGAPPRPVDQKELDGLLGLGFDSYLFSIFFAQFAPAFIDLRPSEQMSVYSAALGLDLWEQAAEAAGKQAKALEADVARHKEALAGLNGQLQEARSGLAGLDREEEEWLEGMAKKEADLEAKVAEASGPVAKAKKERDRYEEGSKKFREWREQVEQAARELALAGAEERRIEADIRTLSGKEKVTKCPACGGPITVEHLKKERAKKEAELEKAKAKSTAALAEHDRRTREMVKFRDEEVKLLDASRRLATLEADHKNATQALERLRAEENPYERRRAAGKARIASMEKDIAAKTTQLETAEHAQGAAQFWTKGFKELRLSLIEESLAQLSVEANSVLVELGLQDWSLEFDVERETKRGTVSKGFTVLVRAPHVKEAVPWECWSGGESQRLRVAASLGFAELICSRLGASPNIEFWDEPSQWLSEGGIHDLLSSLADRAARRGKVILLADHRALDFGGFAGSILVTKTAKGSEISVGK